MAIEIDAPSEVDQGNSAKVEPGVMSGAGMRCGDYSKGSRNSDVVGV